MTVSTLLVMSFKSVRLRLDLHLLLTEVSLQLFSFEGSSFSFSCDSVKNGVMYFPEILIKSCWKCRRLIVGHFVSSFGCAGRIYLLVCPIISVFLIVQRRFFFSSVVIWLLTYCPFWSAFYPVQNNTFQLFISAGTAYIQFISRILISVLYILIFRRFKEVWPKLQRANPGQVKLSDFLSFWPEGVGNYISPPLLVSGAAQTSSAVFSSSWPCLGTLLWVSSVRQILHHDDINRSQFCQESLGENSRVAYTKERSKIPRKMCQLSEKCPYGPDLGYL